MHVTPLIAERTSFVKIYQEEVSKEHSKGMQHDTGRER
jgi:hypothetical protein